jgi:hypothetical protein
MKKSLLVYLFMVCALFVRAQSISIISQTNSPCFNSCSGAVTFSISGASGPFTVTGGCSTSTSTAFSGNTVTLSGLCPSCPLYTFIFNNLFSIVGTKTVNISSPPPLFAIMSKTNTCCFGTCNGAISPTVTGGTTPYSYTWQPSFVGPGPDIYNLCAGNYSLTVTDMNGCTSTFTNTITQPSPLTVSVTQAPSSCSTCCDGTVTATASGGTPPYTFTIFPGGTSNGSGNFPNVCNGTYSVCVSDNGCCMTCGGVSVVTSLKNLQQEINNISVFPNPSSGRLFIKHTVENPSLEFELYDLLGKKVASGITEGEISLAGQETGIYELRLKKDKEIIYKGKIEIIKN